MFGEWLAEKWEAATDAGRKAGSAVHEGASRAAAAAKDAAVAGYEATRDAAVAAYDATVDAIDRADNAVRKKVRADLQDFAYDAADDVAQVRRTYRQGAELAGKAGKLISDATEPVRDGIRDLAEKIGVEFPDAPPAEPVAACPLDCEDGDFLVPNAAGGCDRIKSGSTPAETTAAMRQARAQAVKSQSACCAGKPAKQRQKTIFYTNGIKTDRTAHCATLHRMKDIMCGQVVGIFNATEGDLTDAMRTADARDFLRREMRGGRLNNYDGFSPAVGTIRRTMVVTLLSGEEFNMFAHSEGGAITSLGTHRAIRDLQFEGVGPPLVGNANITSMGSAAPAWQDGPNYNHYIHVNDTTPNLLGSGDSDSSVGQGATIHRFDGSAAVGFGDNPVKRPYAPISPVRDHSVDDSYLEYYNEQEGGCG